MFAWIGKTVIKLIIFAVITSIGGHFTDKITKSDEGIFWGGIFTGMIAAVFIDF